MCLPDQGTLTSRRLIVIVSHDKYRNLKNTALPQESESLESTYPQSTCPSSYQNLSKPRNGMLAIPNAVYSFFAARNTNTNSDDIHNEVEKGPSHHAQSNSQHHIFLDSKKFSHILPRRHQHRPSNLDLNEPSRAIDTLVNNTHDPDFTRTYRILPIFSGIMIPFSIMLSIPSLTGHWYVRTGEGHTLVEVRPNPILLDVSMGLSMGCGVLASACLVVRFAERMIKQMTFLCILFLTLHGVYPPQFESLNHMVLIPIIRCM